MTHAAAFINLGYISCMSSLIAHPLLSCFWQLSQPLHGLIFRSCRNSVSTSAPVDFAPREIRAAKVELFPFFLGLPKITSTCLFFALCSNVFASKMVFSRLFLSLDGDFRSCGYFFEYSGVADDFTENGNLARSANFTSIAYRRRPKEDTKCISCRPVT